MKKYRFLAYITVWMCCLNSIVYSQEKSSQKDLPSVILIFTKALEDGDTSLLKKMTDERLSYGHSSGKIQNQKAFLQSLSDGSSDFIKIDISKQQIIFFDKIAVVHQDFNATTHDDGKDGSVKLKVLLVFQQQKGKWILLTRQAVKANG